MMQGSCVCDVTQMCDMTHTCAMTHSCACMCVVYVYVFEDVDAFI